jgi:hypothetical protein
MTDSIYTYITPDGSPTQGPADPNAGARGKLYSGLALVLPLLSFLATFGIFTSDQVDSLSGFITAGMGLLGAFGFGLAAVKTNKQIKNGTFEPVPPAPASAVIEQLSQIRNEVDKTVEHAQSQLADGVAAIQAVTSMLPGGSVLGATTARVLSGPVGDLIQAMADSDVRQASNALHRRADDIEG